jgi:phosphatidylinositol alpha-mannosyltransferase
VSPYDLALPGGVPSHIRAQADALRRRGHVVQVYGPASDRGRLRPGERALGGAIALNVGGTVSGLGLSPLADGRVRALLRRDRFDVVHLHEPLTPLLPWLFLVHARVPLVGTFHVHREGGHRLYAAARPLLGRLIARLDHRIAVSAAARRTVARHFPGRYDIIPNGIDGERFRARSPAPAGPAHGGPAILFVGRIEARKGLSYLVRALPAVRARVPAARLVVAGDGPERPAVERLVRALGLEAGVHFAGRVPDERLPAYFHAADVVCAPATGGESFGVVLLEAMAAGRAVVASAIAGYAELLGPSRAGLLVPPADPAALAQAIVRLLQDETLRRALGERARTVAQTYDWRVLVGRIEDIYLRLVRRRP